MLGKGDTDVLFYVVLDFCLGVVAPRRASCDRLHRSVVAIVSPRFDLSVLLMLPLFTDCLALRAAAIGLFEPLGPAFLGGSSLSSPDDYMRLQGFRAVLGTRSLHIYPGDYALLVFLLLQI